jgi:hypothetical protein
MNILLRAASALLFTFIACTVGWAAAASAPPEKILVVDATASPGIVQLDTSRGVQLQRTAAGVTSEQAAAQDVLAVQAALSNTLVEKIQAMGLKAERVPAGTLPGPDELAFTMQITAIQEGNRARRTVVGFGAGKASVRGNATLLRETGAGLEVLQTYSTSADSGRMPGMGVGAAAGGAKSAVTAISGAAHGTAELENSPVAEEATKVADRFSTSLGQYFAAQAWIAPSAIP